MEKGTKLGVKKKRVQGSTLRTKIKRPAVNAFNFWNTPSFFHKKTVKAVKSEPEVVLTPPDIPKPPKDTKPRAQKRIEVRESTECVLNHKSCIKIVELTLPILRENKIEAIAASGHSGLILASIVSFHLQVPLLAIRKPNEGSHDGRRMSSLLDYDKSYRVCILDDHIGGGGTIKNILSVLKDKLGDKAKPAMVFLFNGGTNPSHYQVTVDNVCKELKMDSIPVKGISYTQYAPE